MSEIVLTKESNFKKIKIVPGSASEVIQRMLKSNSSDRLVGTKLDGIEETTGMDASSITKENLRRDFVIVELMSSVNKHECQLQRETPGFFNAIKSAIKANMASIYPDCAIEFFLLQHQRPVSDQRLDRDEHIYRLIITLSDAVDAKTYNFLRSYVRKHFIVQALQTSNVDVFTDYRDHNYKYTNPFDFSSSSVAKYEYVAASQQAIDAHVESLYVSPYIKRVQEREEKKRAREQRKEERKAKKNDQIQGLKYDDDGNLKANSVVNWEYMISHLSTEPLFGLNDLDKEIYVLHDFKKTYKISDMEDVVSLKAGDKITDDTKYAVQTAVEHQFDVIANKDSVIYTALERIAIRNKFNPFINFLTQLPRWDGKKRIENVFIDYLGATKTKINRWLGVSLFLSTLSTVINGSTSQLSFDLIGDQGTGKTTLLRKIFISVKPDLADESWRQVDGSPVPNMRWYTQQPSSFDDKDKDSQQKMVGHLIVNDDEMTIRHASKVDLIKEVLSNDMMTLRLPYARKAKDFDRTWIYAATTNQPFGVYLSQHGNRKFAPVLVRKKKATKHVFPDEEAGDPGLTYQTVLQMWAEALDKFHKLGKKVHTFTVLSEAQDEKLEIVRETLQYVDAVTLVIERYIVDDYKSYYNQTNVDEAYSISLDQLQELVGSLGPSSSKKISMIMKDNLGMIDTTMQVKGKIGLGFAEGEDTPAKVEAAEHLLKARRKAIRGFSDVDTTGAKGEKLTYKKKKSVK